MWWNALENFNKWLISAEIPKVGSSFACFPFSPPLPLSLSPLHKYLSCERSILSTVIGAWGTDKMQSGINIIKTCYRYTVRMQCMSTGPLVNTYPQSTLVIRSYMNELVVFSIFFNLSLNLAIRSSWSESQSAPGLVFADCIELLHLWLQRI